MADHFDITQVEFSAEPKVIIKQKDEEDNCIGMIQHFNAIIIEFLTEPEVKKPKLNDYGSFYIIYSPEKIKLRQRDSAMLNLRLKVNLPDEIEAMIGLLSSFVSRKLSILKLDLKQKKRQDNSTRYFKQTLL